MSLPEINMRGIMDWSDVIKAAKNYMECNRLDTSDEERWIFEAVMDAVYGPSWYDLRLFIEGEI